jgi:6-pyruvoyl-tetrahydropterin synthase
MYEITEWYAFTATHKVRGVVDSHPCRTVHLHRWVVSVVLVAGHLPLRQNSELLELEPVRHYLSRHLDGKYLNDVLTVAPTPALIAQHIAEWCCANLNGYARYALRSIAVSTEPGARTHGVKVSVARPDE